MEHQGKKLKKLIHNDPRTQVEILELMKTSRQAVHKWFELSILKNTMLEKIAKAGYDIKDLTEAAPAYYKRPDQPLHVQDISALLKEMERFRELIAHYQQEQELFKMEHRNIQIEINQIKIECKETDKSLNRIFGALDILKAR